MTLSLNPFFFEFVYLEIASHRAAGSLTGHRFCSDIKSDRVPDKQEWKTITCTKLEAEVTMRSV